MSYPTGMRLYFAEAQLFSLPGLILFPKKAGILYSTALATGVLWRKQMTSCFEIRALGLGAKKDSDMIALFVKRHDGECTIYTFPEQSVIGITNLKDQDIIPEVPAPPCSPEWRTHGRPKSSSIPPFLPHLLDNID